MSLAQSPVTSIPHLHDGACSAAPRSQQPLWCSLKQEISVTLPMLLHILWVLLIRRRPTSWPDTAEAAARIVLACFEASAMLAAIPLWLVLPGALFAVWAGACAVVVAVACWMLKGDDIAGRTYRFNVGESGGWIKGQEAEDEKWMFVGGMGMSSRHCHEKTLPALSRLFNRPVTCICMSTYGILFDMMAMVLQRCVPMPSQARRTLYTQMRCALLDDSVDRCVVLCHNDGAVLVSQAVTQLCADLPPERLGKLEVYTFGAAASEFVVPPRNTITVMDSKPVRQNEDRINDQLGIHLEHFAMPSDPFAQMGVLHSVRRDMERRLCGSVFILNDTNHPRSQECSRGVAKWACLGLAMEEYLVALFPSQMVPDSTAATHYCGLGDVVAINRKCAEEDEIAPMGNYHAASPVRNGGKRLSWMGLADTAKHKNGMSAGMAGLEMARKACEKSTGSKGSEVSRLGRYVALEGLGGTDQMFH
ncbi:hypothetical protein C7999DRAFT_40723 [Corynascus novoguineensis]|uniref:Uncharacterized protein n=1 Tax=Corynascus novoguineensis TaxID=1126955 RepID=A0AAN7CTJ9_9PEZI|nr:hypothetical protein C7999DRAFT_40723 [Corynascus novoguineensis]